MGSTPRTGTRRYVTVYIGLLLIVGVEVALTYAGMSRATFLTALLALAALEAGLGLAFFMHMKYERRILFWCLIPALIFVFLMLNHLWRDAARMISLHL